MKHRDAYCSFCRKHYRDVGPLIVGPSEAYICGECIELCQSILEQERRRRGCAPSMPTVEQIQTHLENIVGGQRQAVNALATAVYRHYEQTTHGARDPNGAILLVSATPSTRVLLACAAAYIFQVPLVTGRADGLAESDGSANQPHPTFYRLLATSAFDLDAAQRGIVYIDGADVPSGQLSILKTLAAVQVDVIPPRLQIDTTRILFICGGDFGGLDEVIGRRGRHREQPITRDDLTSFGMMTELAAHFGTIASVEPLGEEPLARLLGCVEFRRLLGASV